MHQIQPDRPFSEMPVTPVTVDLNVDEGPLELWRQTLGQGGINSLPLPPQVIKGAANLHPRLVRIFIQEFFHIYPKHGQFDWRKLDAYMESFAKTGAHVVAAITIKPPPLFPVVDEKIWRPNDVGEWQNVISALVKRYSIDRQLVTYWEIGNETDIGENGGCPYLIQDPKEYAEYYRMTIDPILQTFPAAKVGGCAVANAGGDYLPAFIRICREEGLRLDFISWHLYSDSPEQHAGLIEKYRKLLDEFGSNALQTAVPAESSISGQVPAESGTSGPELGVQGQDLVPPELGVRGQVPPHLRSKSGVRGQVPPELAGAGYPLGVARGSKPEMLVTEWSKSFEPVSIEEAAFEPRRAAIIASNILAMNAAKVDWTFYYHLWDQTCYLNDFATIFQNPEIMYHHWNEVPHRFGLFGVDGEVRPQYFVYWMLQRMGSRQVHSTTGSPFVKILAGQDGAKASVLIVNHSDAPAPDCIAALSLSGLEPGPKQLSVYRIDRGQAWSSDNFEMIPVEKREVDVKSTFHCQVFCPGESVCLFELQPSHGR